MKKMMIAAVLFVSMSTMAFAQQSNGRKEHKTPEERAQKTTDMLATKLSLSEEQKSKIYAINLENIRGMEADRQQRRQADRKLMKEAMDQKDEQITSLLDDAQKSTYQNLKKERFQGRKLHKRSDRQEKLKKEKQEG